MATAGGGQNGNTASADEGERAGSGCRGRSGRRAARWRRLGGPSRRSRGPTPRTPGGTREGLGPAEEALDRRVLVQRLRRVGRPAEVVRRRSRSAKTSSRKATPSRVSGAGVSSTMARYRSTYAGRAKTRPAGRRHARPAGRWPRPHRAARRSPRALRRGHGGGGTSPHTAAPSPPSERSRRSRPDVTAARGHGQSASTTPIHARRTAADATGAGPRWAFRGGRSGPGAGIHPSPTDASPLGLPNTCGKASRPRVRHASHQLGPHRPDRRRAAGRGRRCRPAPPGDPHRPPECRRRPGAPGFRLCTVRRRRPDTVDDLVEVG